MRSRELQLPTALAGKQVLQTGSCRSRGERLLSTFLKGTDYLQPFSRGSPQVDTGMCWWAVQVGSNPLRGCSTFSTEKAAMGSIANQCSLANNLLLAPYLSTFSCTAVFYLVSLDNYMKSKEVAEGEIKLSSRCQHLCQHSCHAFILLSLRPEQQ